MNAADALLTDCTAKSFVELSLSPCFERKWHSLYKAMRKGEVDRDALQKLFAKYAPEVGEQVKPAPRYKTVYKAKNKTKKTAAVV